MRPAYALVRGSVETSRAPDRIAAASRSARRRPPLRSELAAFGAAELGIDIPAILRRTRSVLTFRLSGHDMEHLDLGGPLIFMALLGVAHLLVSLCALPGTPAERSHPARP